MDLWIELDKLLAERGADSVWFKKVSGHAKASDVANGRVLREDKIGNDFAAGALIAQEGGALVSNFKGDPKYIDANNVIASTSKVYKSILKSVKPYYQD